MWSRASWWRTPATTSPQALDIYFLEDFRQAQRYLPQVKPTFFFSVPRVFERAWEGLEESRPGKFYLGLAAGSR